MRTRHLASAVALLLLPIFAQALPPDRDSRPMRHYILESEVPLDAAASAELASKGIVVQQPMANHRYLVAMRDGDEAPADARIHSLRAYDASHKIARAAYAEAAQGKAFARLRILFQKEVTFEQAQSAIEAAGGTIDMPLAVASANPQRLTVRIPSSAVTDLAKDERVFGIYGPPLHARSLNSVAAQISKVTPLYTAPYGLSGAGVVLSLFEPEGRPDVAHTEFGGRVISHFDAARPVNDHATHVSGTIVAAGVNPLAKGMSPAGTLHAFDANVDTDVLMTAKAALTTIGSVADNNSWDYELSWQGSVWYGAGEYLGGYSGIESEPYDKVMITPGEPLVLHASGNDAQEGNPSLASPWSPHKHFNYDTNKVDSHTFCYSQNGSGSDCPTAAPFNCSTDATAAGERYCETQKHPTHTASTSVGLLASTKNSVTVGAIQDDGVSIAPFSSRGPTLDGRIKPELVADGYRQFSTMPNNSYSDGTDCSCPGFGTSMATPVVTGVAGLLTQQFRKILGKTPDAPMLKALLIAGADDLGNPGPDYTFGFGLVDAKASVDLITDDNGTGSRIHRGTVGNGQDIHFPITLAASQKLRVVLGWFDPEVLLQPNPQPNDDDLLADKTLINDLDVKVIDPTGATVLPYVLNPATPNAFATKGANHIDTTEELEIASAVPGTYDVIVHGAIADTRTSSQDFVLITNGGVVVPVCTDNYEPNDTQATAFGNLVNAKAITAKICSAADVDYYTFTSNSTSALSVDVAATDTPLKVTLSSSASTPVTVNIPANNTAKLQSFINTLVSPTPSVAFFLRVEANGTVGATGSYTVTPFYTFTSTPRKHSAKH
ncbi:MAG TPA: S8 family serine peptidase [Thermoanaerobaculia bacterium]|nr:S8 family serine peptidase [Thermoanaerobaculia bacterium]